MEMIIIGCLFIVGLLVSLIVIRGWQIQHSAYQKQFLAGKIPDKLPDGVYHGLVPNLTTTWQGKKFDAANRSGINVFNNSGQNVELHRFKMGVGQGIQDHQLAVVKIDYNLRENSWWIKPILDEIVEIAPNKYLGKISVRVIPGWTWVIGWFQLQK